MPGDGHSQDSLLVAVNACEAAAIVVAYLLKRMWWFGIKVGEGGRERERGIYMLSVFVWIMSASNRLLRASDSILGCQPPIYACLERYMLPTVDGQPADA